MADEEYEQTLYVAKECFVYKIPPRGPAGYKAGDWDLSNPIWTGRLLVVAQGEKCRVKLEDPSNGDIFAVCPVSETSVEPVNDSSRYFVLRIEDGSGRHAFIGMGFSERSEAFDFTAALQDHKRFVKSEKEAQEAIKRLESQPKKDYSLPQGTTIHVNIKTAKKESTSSSKSSSSSGGSGGSGGFLLPPPPGSKAASTSAAFPAFTPAAATQTSQQQQTNALFDWSDFTSSSSSTPQNQQQSNNLPTDWVAFQ